MTEAETRAKMDVSTEFIVMEDNTSSASSPSSSSSENAEVVEHVDNSPNDRHQHSTALDIKSSNRNEDKLTITTPREVKSHDIKEDASPKTSSSPAPTSGLATLSLSSSLNNNNNNNGSLSSSVNNNADDRQLATSSTAPSGASSAAERDDNLSSTPNSRPTSPILSSSSSLHQQDKPEKPQPPQRVGLSTSTNALMVNLNNSSSSNKEDDFKPSSPTAADGQHKPIPPMRSPNTFQPATIQSQAFQQHRMSMNYRTEEVYTQLAGLTEHEIKQIEKDREMSRGQPSEPVGFLAFVDANAPLPPPSSSTAGGGGQTSTGSGSEDKAKKKGWFTSFRKKKDSKDDKKEAAISPSTSSTKLTSSTEGTKTSTDKNAKSVPDKNRATSPTPQQPASPTLPTSGGGGAGTATTTTEEKLKATDDEAPKEKQTFVVSTCEELPEDCQKLMKQSGLSNDVMQANFNILLNVLHFRTGKILKTPQNVNDPPYPSLPKTTRFANGADLITPLPDIKKTYKEPKETGHGGFGTVFHAKSALHKGKVVAVKKMPHKTKKQKISNNHEIAVLSACTHPNVVKYLASHEVGEELWVVMEFLEGGTFEEAAKACRFSEANLAYVARELLKGISYLHHNEIAHRDLKSANIMMGIRGEVKLIDFGLCADLSVGNPKHMVGSPFWMPPEMIKCKPHDYSVDIWSFAISLLEMANQKPPMIESAVKAMFTVGTDGVTQFFVEPERWSVTFKDFLNRCLRLDPAERATADELLAHPFIRLADSRANMESLLRRIFLRDSLMNSGF